MVCAVMESPACRNPVLASLALVALAAYVLACASFSPDDSKVAFPAFDAQSGELGISVYDRKTRRSETVFTLSAIVNAATPRYEGRMLRMQWIDNQRLLVGWAGVEGKEAGLNVLSLPLGRKGAVRYWQLGEAVEMNEQLARPLALAGSRLFVNVDSNLVTRLDLDTGQAVSHLCRGERVTLYPSGESGFVFYLAPRASGDGRLDFGRLDAATFALTPLMQLDEFPSDAKEPVAISADGRRLAWLHRTGHLRTLRVARSGAATQAIPVGSTTEDLSIGGLCFSEKGDRVFGSFARKTGAEAPCSYGLLEIPLDGQPVQSIRLFDGPPKGDTDAVLYLQPALSHDGKTLAVCNTYVAGDPDGAPGAASRTALFLVDLTRQPRVVREVALPLPKATHPVD